MVFANILGPDLVIVLVIALVVLFGSSQLPKLARNLGGARKEFHDSLAEAGHSQDHGATRVVSPSSTDDDKITLSKKDLEALLAEREARAKQERETL